MSVVLYFLVDTLASLYLAALMVRLLLQAVRADFRNPLARGLLQLTNPVVLPLRRLLPALGPLDSGPLLGLGALMACKLLLLAWISGQPLPAVPGLLVLLAVALLRLLLQVYLYAILVYALAGLLAQGGYSPVRPLLGALCEPVLRPLRRHLPTVAGWDLSPLWACIAIQALLLLPWIR